MNTLTEILAANKKFVKELPDEFVNYNTSSIPKRQLAIFTCMDTRLVDFLEPAMGIRRGEAKVIKNAGNAITGPFEATIRSLVLSIFELGVNEIVVIGHLDCGMAHASSQELSKKMLAKGISQDAIKMIDKELEQWLDNFHHPLDNIESVVYKIRTNPLIPKNIPVHGLMFNPHNGELQIIVDGYKHCENT